MARKEDEMVPHGSNSAGGATDPEGETLQRKVLFVLTVAAAFSAGVWLYYKPGFDALLSFLGIATAWATSFWTAVTARVLRKVLRTIAAVVVLTAVYVVVKPPYREQVVVTGSMQVDASRTCKPGYIPRFATAAVSTDTSTVSTTVIEGACPAGFTGTCSGVAARGVRSNRDKTDYDVTLSFLCSPL